MSEDRETGRPAAVIEGSPPDGADLGDLASIDSAEALFEALDVPYDPRVLAVARLHVLRRYGRTCALVDAEPGLSPAERRERRRAALAEAHASFTRETPREARLFGCFLDRAPLVTLGAQDRPPDRDR